MTADQPSTRIAPLQTPGVGVVAAPAPLAVEPMPTAPQPNELPPQTSQAPAPTLAIHLSAGVAVPQSLPEGTQIGVSVDYEIRGELHRSSRYYLVVESSVGETRVEVTLSPTGGTIQGFCPVSVRPEHQPFHARIDEHPGGASQPVPASNRAPLKTSY
ncbi:MAG: hypothetical protein WD872_04835 [Pirellulaceae bacterium]